MSPTARAMMMKMKRVMMETMNLPSVVCCCLPVTAVDRSPTSDLTAKNTHLNPKNHSLKNTTKNTSLPLYTPPPPEGVVKQSLQQGTQFQYQRKILAQLSTLVNPIFPFTSQPIKCSTCSSFMTGGRRAWEPVKGAGVVEQPQQGHWCGFNGEDYCNSRLSLTFMN